MNTNQNSSAAHPMHHSMRKILIGLTIVGAVLITYLAYINPSLFQASLTGGTSQPANNVDLYIPNDYKALPGDKEKIKVYAGQDIVQLLNMSVTFKTSDVGKMKFVGASLNSGLSPQGGGFTTTNPAVDEIRVSFTPQSVMQINKGQLMFELDIEIDPNTNSGDVISVSAYPGDVSKSYIVQQFGQQGTQRQITFSDGKIEIGGGTQQVLTPFAGGTNVNTDPNFYIPNTYTAVKGQSDQIEIRAGKAYAADQLDYLNLILEAPKDKLTFLSIDKSGGKLSAESPQVTIDSSNNRVAINYRTLSNPISLADNDLLFKLNTKLDANLVTGDKIEIKMNPASKYKTQNVPFPGTPTFSEGLITIQNAGASTQQTSSDALTGILLTLAPGSITQLPVAEREKAYQSAYISINSDQVVGRTITIEGDVYTFKRNAAVPACATDITPCINSIAAELKSELETSGTVSVSDTGIPGVLKITPNGLSNSTLINATDLLGTTAGDVFIVPALDYTINLGLNDTYQLRLIGKNKDGSLLNLTFNDVKWQPQPVNQVDKTSLDGGLLKRGDRPGTTSIFVEKEGNNKQIIKSNQLTVRVPSESVIEYLRRIGTGSLARGSQLNVEFKITDVNQIADIQDIRMAIVRTAQTNYEDISKDSAAVRFVGKVVSQITTQSSGTQPQSGAVNVQENFRIYNVGLEIPQQTTLTDGNYQLVLDVTDVNGRTVGTNLPIKIGTISSGDVNGDGSLSMLDVILAFQIVSGNLPNPTASQVAGADFNGDGKVTMIDVINLFNQVNK